MEKFDPTLVLVCSQIVSSEALSLFRKKARYVEWPLLSRLCLVEKRAQNRPVEVQGPVQLCC